MWSNLLKFAAILLFNRKVSNLTENLLHLRDYAADYAEHRAAFIKQDFLKETHRLAISLVGLLVVFSMFIFTGLLGIIWLFSLLWEHPDRSLILGLVMLIPAIIGMIAFWAVWKTWKTRPLFASSLTMISQDWTLFRNEMTPADAPQSGAPAAASEPGAAHSATP